MAEIAEMLESVEAAHTKGYKFHCSGSPNPCYECGASLVYFVTQDIEEAFQHSKRNAVAMWIHKD